MRQLGYDDQYIDLYLKTMCKTAPSEPTSTPLETESSDVIPEKIPSKADITAWYKEELITIDQYREEMRLRGYSDEDIELYLKNM